MPTSGSFHLSYILDHILKEKPKSVLDVGVGHGKFGFLCREFLDIFCQGDNWRTNQRKTQIDGVEIFKPYLDEFKHLDHIYDNIWNCSLQDFSFNHYDCIIIGDVLEHLTKEEGSVFLERCILHSNTVILSVPLGDFRYQYKGENKYESHLSMWTEEELSKYSPFVNYYNIHKVWPFITTQGKKIDCGVFIYKTK